MRPADPAVTAAARQVFAYLAECDPLPAMVCDAIIGFGMFDLGLARFCGNLFRQGAGRQIIFTGGIGAGTGKLGGPEATVWRRELQRSHPEIGDDRVIVENRSTHTAENIAFTAKLLEQGHPQLRFGEGIRTAIIVASPSRLRRVGLAMRRQQPDVRVFRQRPDTDFDREQALYAHHDVEYLAHLSGELDRIVEYATRGWIAEEPLPPAIVSAHAPLKSTLHLTGASTSPHFSPFNCSSRGSDPQHSNPPATASSSCGLKAKCPATGSGPRDGFERP